MTELTITELAPGVHRIETVVDDKLHGYHLLDGAAGPMIVDPGYAAAPTEVYEPALAARDQSLADVGLAVITHADADHFGGNHRLREHSPGVTIACHAADAAWVESTERIMTERYDMFAADHGISYPDEITDWLTDMMGPDEPVDLRLRGGETLRVRDRQFRVLHTPGHTPGHLMLYDPATGTMLGGDGFFGRGLRGVDGEYLQPPPYHLYPEYERTIELVDALAPTTLSFTHYDLLEGAAVEEFVQTSRDWITEFDATARDVVAAQAPVTLRAAIDAVVERRGTFGLDLDLAFPLTAHYGHHVAEGRLETTVVDGRTAWRPAED